MRASLWIAACLSVCGGMMLAPAAWAQRESNVNGSKLLSLCTAATPANCDAYLSGAADAMAAAANTAACIPVAVTGRQLRDVVLKYLHDHPRDLQLKAGTLTTRAYAGAFACRK